MFIISHLSKQIVDPLPQTRPHKPPNWSKQGSVTVPITVVLDLYTYLLTITSDVVYWHQSENFPAMDVFKGEKHLETIDDVFKSRASQCRFPSNAQK